MGNLRTYATFSIFFRFSLSPPQQEREDMLKFIRASIIKGKEILKVYAYVYIFNITLFNDTRQENKKRTVK